VKATRPYGYELILDVHKCDASMFTRESLERYFDEICELIDMEKCEAHFWDDIGVPLDERQTAVHTKGTSAVCFILTSSIVVHTLDLLESVYVNVFSCKPFQPEPATAFTQSYFSGTCKKSTFLYRE